MVFLLGVLHEHHTARWRASVPRRIPFFLLHSVIIITFLDQGVRRAAGTTRFTQSFATVVLIVLPITLVAARPGFNFIELPFLRRRVRWVEEPRPVAALSVSLQAAG